MASGSDFRSASAVVREVLVRRFSVDLRALATLRIALAVVLIVDLCLRARDLVTFYSDAGVLPRSVLSRLYPTFHSASIHTVSGEVWVQIALFLVAAAFAGALLVGYRPRLAAIASFVLLVSLQARNPLVLNAGDILLRRLLFWGLFLPLGGRWAVTTRRVQSHDRRVAGLASAALLIQVVLVYATNVAFKLRGDTWISGDAIRYVFSLDQFTVGLGSVLVQYSALAEVLATGWFALLCSSILLLVLTGRARMALLSLFAVGHVGMLLTMDLGIFPLVSLVALVPFVPPTVWDRVDGFVRSVTPTLDRPLPAATRGGFRTPVIGRARTIRSLVLAVLLVTMLLLNGLAVGVVDRPASVPDEIEDRSWNMFGNPPRAEEWYVATGTLASGTQVTTHVSSTRWNRSTDGDHRYPGARWRKYQSKLDEYRDEELRGRLATDLCRRLALAGDEPVRSITLTRVEERTRLGEPDQQESVESWQFPCATTGSTAP